MPLIIVFGPREPLTPLRMAPAAGPRVRGVALVAGVFSAATVVTRGIIVALGPPGAVARPGAPRPRDAGRIPAGQRAGDPVPRPVTLSAPPRSLPPAARRAAGGSHTSWQRLSPRTALKTVTPVLTAVGPEGLTSL